MYLFVHNINALNDTEDFTNLVEEWAFSDTTLKQFSCFRLLVLL